MDREPLAAPFPVGARVVYTGDLKIYRNAADSVPIFAAGSIGVVTGTRPGRRGTLRTIDLEDGEDPFTDTTRDGYSVVDFGNGWTRAVDADADGYELAPEGNPQ